MGEALDLVIERISKSSLDFWNIDAVSGGRRQHGSVNLLDQKEFHDTILNILNSILW